MPSVLFSWSFTTVGVPAFGLSGSVIAEKRIPIAIAIADPENAVMGSVIKLNGRSSYDPYSAPPRTALDAVAVGVSDVVTSASFALTADDLGRNLILGGDDAGEYRIYQVDSPTQARVVRADNGGGVSFIGSSALSWIISDRLYYKWEMVSVPVGSRTGQESLRLLDTDSSLVSFSPDIVGEYTAELVVSNGAYESEPARVGISVRSILVPHGRGLVPDGKFIWSYIRDVWNGVEGREWFETLWSALIQICGADLLKLYQVDFNKSIRDIQSQYQQRWLAYEPKLSLVESDLTFFLGNHCAGKDASTEQVGVEGQAVLVWNEETPTTWAATTGYALGDVVSPTGSNEDFGLYFRCILAGTSGATEPDWVAAFGEVTADGTARWEMVSLTKEVVVSLGSVFQNVSGTGFDIVYDAEQPENLRPYGVQGNNIQKSGYLLDANYPPPDPLPDLISIAQAVHFSYQSTSWTIIGAIGDIRIGDVIHFRTGPNAGFYRILDLVGLVATVDKAPKSFSDATTSITYKPNFYRPVGYRLNIIPSVITDTFAVPYDSGGDALGVVIPGRVVTVGGQGYTILRTSIDQSQVIPRTVVVTDGGAVLSKLNGLNWRAPHTLVSKSQNFEELGVSTGDLLVVAITDEATHSVVEVATQVVGVDGYHLGFIITDEFPVAGEIPDIPDQTFLDLASGFGIDSVYVNNNGVLTFEKEADDLKDEMETLAFQRKYWNTELSPKSDISVGGRVFRIHPSFVIRNKKIPVDSDLRSIPLLQEWIVQPELSTHDGKVFQVKKGVEYEIPRLPVSLVENLDYVIDGDYAFDGEMTFDTGTDVIFVEGANFLDRGVVPGDAFVIDSPVTLYGTYYIAAVLDADRVLLTRPVPLYVLGTTVTATVRIERKQSGHFLRFAPGVFTAKKTSPERLWGEVSFFSNDSNIEANFGIMVGLTREDLEKVSASASYKQAVAGLMFAYSRGSIVDKIRLGAQILLGLPFVENRGIIRSIENDYRLSDDGVPVLGRALIEDIDESGSPQGTSRIYTYPIDLESVDYAGIDVNPATGKTYVVGDVVEKFASLVKGVRVIDYLSDPDLHLSDVQKLQQFHTIRVRSNDNIFDLDELGLVSDFLRKITPHYVSYIISIAMEVVDNVEITDDVTKRLKATLEDNACFALPHAIMFDSRQLNGPRAILWEDGYYWVRLTGKGLDSTALQGSPGDPQVLTRTSGGMVTPGGGEGPVAMVGDKLLIVDGINEGLYNISVLTDTLVTVDDAPNYGFQPLLDQRFALLRPINGLIRSGSLTSAGNVATMAVGLQAEGVAPGDLLVVDRGAGVYSRHFIKRVGAHADAPALVAGQVEVTPSLGTLGSSPYAIYRVSLVEAPYAVSATVTSTGTAYGALSNLLVQGLLEPGDELEVDDGAYGRLTVLDPFRNYFVPVLPAGPYTVKVCKKGHTETPIGFDHLEKFDPGEQVDVSLVDTTGAGTTVGLPTVTFTALANPAAMGVLPGDILALLSGADSAIDVGYGPGLYPIVEVSATNVKLAGNLTASGSFAWKIIRRRSA